MLKKTKLTSLAFMILSISILTIWNMKYTLAIESVDKNKDKQEKNTYSRILRSQDYPKPKIVKDTETPKVYHNLKIIRGIVLVNREYGLPKDYYKGIDPKAESQVNKMLDAAKEEEGLDYTIHSDHRTHNDQKILFEKYTERYGYDRANESSAKPGHSEHETGYTFDICDGAWSHYLKESFGESEEGIWLRENAHRFGFILRYPKNKTHITGYIYEPWHFRYVGEEHAEEIYKRDITLEEYLLPDEY